MIDDAKPETGSLRGSGAPALTAALALVLLACSGGDATPHQDSTALYVAQPRADSESGQAATVTVPADTMVSIEFIDGLSSETSAAGDSFRARVVQDVTVDGRVAIHAGDEVEGKVLDAVPSKRIGGKASLRLAFTNLRLPTGETVALPASMAEGERNQPGKDTAAGAAIAATNEPGPVVIPSGTIVAIRIDAPAEVPVS